MLLYGLQVCRQTFTAENKEIKGIYYARAKGESRALQRAVSGTCPYFLSLAQLSKRGNVAKNGLLTHDIRTVDNPLGMPVVTVSVITRLWKFMDVCTGVPAQLHMYEYIERLIERRTTQLQS